MGNVISLAVLYGLYFAVPFLVLRTTYKLLSSPLRHYPGPRLAKITDAYSAFFAYNKTLHWQAYAHSREYGDVYRIGPNKLIFNTATAVKDIYLNPRVAKGEPYNHGMFAAKNRNLIMTTDRVDHKKKLKVIATVLNERSMRIFQPKMVDRINEFLRKILTSSTASAAASSSSSPDVSSPVNVLDLATYMTTDIAADLAFGHPLNTQSNPANRFFPKTLKEWSWRINFMMQFPPLRYYNLLMLTLKYKQTAQTGKAVRDIVRTREAMDRYAFHDFYSIVIDEIKLGNSFLESEMWPHATSFLAAGGLTTAATIAGTLFYLSRYPACYRRAAREVRDAFSSADEIVPGPKLAECSYLRACIDETLRMSPPITTIFWRQLDPLDTTGEPFIVDGHVIPPGTQVAISIYALSHNEEIYPNPWVYRPERFLEHHGDGDELKAAREAVRMAHIPFVTGDRTCPGKTMAWIEMSMALARLFWYFDFEAAPGELGQVGQIMRPGPDGKPTAPEYRTEDWYAAEHEGPYLVFRQRDNLADDLLQKP
ncbi:Trichodiene oxygenase [Talaromyces islandicus]|uniref:Trichodiene oxygenase n=1 Tax=Talaromyces islandicus TaxID=28573 RepID=A0A0U1M9I6_TALIS|nr:Trichodiene oxygenase [Talaromyces islandicus]